VPSAHFRSSYTPNCGHQQSGQPHIIASGQFTGVLHGIPRVAPDACAVLTTTPPGKAENAQFVKRLMDLEASVGIGRFNDLREQQDVVETAAGCADGIGGCDDRPGSDDIWGHGGPVGVKQVGFVLEPVRAARNGTPFQSRHKV